MYKCVRLAQKVIVLFFIINLIRRDKTLIEQLINYSMLKTPNDYDYEAETPHIYHQASKISSIPSGRFKLTNSFKI